MYESKRRMHYWLAANNVPHPKTWVFYDRQDAIKFCSACELPVVYKSDCWSSALGVRIFRKRAPLIRFVAKCFEKGSVCREGDPRDRQWGSVLLQEYLPDVDEWRVIRIGRSYFAYLKGKRGDFHSGSHQVIFADPPRQLLDLIREVANRSNFTSMSFDVFETPEGGYLVNELHPVFGRDPWDHSMEINGKPGRYVYDEGEATWKFEEGIFTENSCCNLRVQVVLNLVASAGAARPHSGR
jgi:glutathione synthase/RimK-type ligase-like ATP-grasp enzyme